MVSRLKNLFLMILVLGLFCSCATMRTDLTPEDQIKLDLAVLTNWYEQTYMDVLSKLSDPFFPEKKKKYLKQVINPELNSFKKDLLEVIDEKLALKSLPPEQRRVKISILRSKIASLYARKATITSQLLSLGITTPESNKEVK